MKKLRIFLLSLGILSTSLLVSCFQSGPSSNSVNCSSGREVCITIDKVQPFTMGEPMQLNINVSSTEDFNDLHVALFTFSGVTVDGPQTWENYLTTAVNDPGMAYWNFAIKAGQTLTFKRVLRFPPEEGYYWMVAEVVSTHRIYTGSESLTVLLEHKGVQVVRNGTPMPPHTPEFTMPAYGPGTPAPTFITAPPTQTPFPTFTPPSTPSSPLLETSYPPPSTPTPTPTSQSSLYP